MSQEKGKLWENLQTWNTPGRMSQIIWACETCEEKARYSEESFVLKNICKDKGQICKGHVSLGVTGGSKENKNILKHIEMQEEKKDLICS